MILIQNKNFTDMKDTDHQRTYFGTEVADSFFLFLLLFIIFFLSKAIKVVCLLTIRTESVSF